MSRNRWFSISSYRRDLKSKIWNFACMWMRLLFLDSWSLFIVTDILWRDFFTEAILISLFRVVICAASERWLSSSLTGVNQGVIRTWISRLWNLSNLRLFKENYYTYRIEKTTTFFKQSAVTFPQVLIMFG